jgi:hypothetical protein
MYPVSQELPGVIQEVFNSTMKTTNVSLFNHGRRSIVQPLRCARWWTHTLKSIDYRDESSICSDGVRLGSALGAGAQNGHRR